MATTSLTMPPNYEAAAPKYRMLITTSDGKIEFGALFAPTEVEYSGFGRTWSEVARAGRTPMLLHESNKLRKMSFKMTIAKKDPYADIRVHLDRLRQMADSGVPVKIIYGGGFDNFSWRMTDYSVTSTMRHPSDSYVTRAEVSLEFTVVSDIKAATGPVTGGVTTAKSSSTTSKKKSTTVSQASRTSKAPRYYIFKKGDTLYKLAIKWYGDSSRWRELADKNGIKDVRKIPVGKKLKY